MSTVQYWKRAYSTVLYSRLAAGHGEGIVVATAWTPGSAVPPSPPPRNGCMVCGCQEPVEVRDFRVMEPDGGPAAHYGACRRCLRELDEAAAGRGGEAGGVGGRPRAGRQPGGNTVAGATVDYTVILAGRTAEEKAEVPTWLAAWARCRHCRQTRFSHLFERAEKGLQSVAGNRGCVFEWDRVCPEIYDRLSGRWSQGCSGW